VKRFNTKKVANAIAQHFGLQFTREENPVTYRYEFNEREYIRINFGLIDISTQNVKEYIFPHKFDTDADIAAEAIKRIETINYIIALNRDKQLNELLDILMPVVDCTLPPPPTKKSIYTPNVIFAVGDMCRYNKQDYIVLNVTDRTVIVYYYEAYKKYKPQPPHIGKRVFKLNEDGDYVNRFDKLKKI